MERNSIKGRSGTVFISVNILDKDCLIYFDYTITNSGCQAQTYGPPEKCYPAEDMEYKLSNIHLALDKPGKTEYLDAPKYLLDWCEEYLDEHSDYVYDVVVLDLED